MYDQRYANQSYVFLSELLSAEKSSEMSFLLEYRLRIRTALPYTILFDTDKFGMEKSLDLDSHMLCEANFVRVVDSVEKEEEEEEEKEIVKKKDESGKEEDEEVSEAPLTAEEGSGEACHFEWFLEPDYERGEEKPDSEQKESPSEFLKEFVMISLKTCLLYTSDAADE